MTEKSTLVRPTPAFQRAARAQAVEPSQKLTPTDRLAIAIKTHETALKVKAHHAKHAQAWISQRYGDLLRKEALTPQLKPSFALDDPKPRIKRQAEMAVAHKLAMRLQRVNDIGKQMLVGVKHERGRDQGRGE
jgi:hypothetical protein